MLKTKFSRNHIHVLDTLLSKMAELWNDISLYSFKNLNPLVVYVHDKTVVVKLNSDRDFYKEFLKEEFYGKAVCSDSDVFDLQTGIKIARTKLFKTLMIYMQKKSKERLAQCKKIMVSFDHIYREKMDESNFYIDKLSSVCDE